LLRYAALDSSQLQCQPADDFEIGNMITVYKIHVSKDRLRAMPSDERSLFILLGHAANQLNLFSKLTLFSLNNTTDQEPESFLSGVQSQMLLRMAIAILHEAWAKIITSRLLSTSLGKDYIPRLDQGGKDAINALQKLFGKSNILSKIRNNYAFHHPYDVDVEAAFKRAESDSNWDNEWNWFFSHSNFNSLYYVSDIIMISGIMNEIGETDSISAQKRLMDEVQTAMNEMTTLIMALTAAIWRKHFGDELEAEKCGNITEAPGLFEFALPFFVEVPDGPLPGQVGKRPDFP
jgi:hypothetical protein